MKNMKRVCWNWQTGTFEGRVSIDVRVQVPSLAPLPQIAGSTINGQVVELV